MSERDITPPAQRAYGAPASMPDRSQFYEDDGVVMPSRLFAEIDRLQAVYEAACAWADHPRPGTGGAENRLRDAIDRARRLASGVEGSR